MATGTETQTVSNSDTFNGLDVTLDVTLPTWTDETLPVDVDITTNGVSPDINIAVVVDTSGSTANSSGSDVDGDGDNDTYLEAQQLAAQELFQTFIDAGYDPAAVEITLIEYNADGATLGTFTLDQQAQFNTAVNGLSAGGTTNYESGLDEVLDTWAAQGDVENTETNAVVFLSDGFRNRGDNASDEVTQLETLYNTSITAIGVGANSSLNDLNVVDNTGGAQQVTDLTQLADIISAPPPLPELVQVDIIIDGVNYGTFTPGDGVLVETPLGYRINCAEIDGWPYVPGTDITVEVLATFDDGSSVLSSGGVVIPVTICFVTGSMILTNRGEVAIEALKAGDLVMTRDNGFQEIRWIGHTTLSAAALNRDPNLRPIKIAAGAFGDHQPTADLMVSRQHRILVEDWRAELLFDSTRVLVPAMSLVNDTTVTTQAPETEITYYHMVFDDHEVVFANGLATESFHPTLATIGAMKPEAKAELLRLFPDLDSRIKPRADTAAYDPAYPVLKNYEAQVLTRRRAG